MGRWSSRFTVYGATGYLGDTAPTTFNRKGVTTMSISPLLPPTVHEEKQFADDGIIWDGFEREYADDVEPLLPTGFQSMAKTKKKSKSYAGSVEPLLPPGV
jgi:hypothetical protein